MPRVSSIGASNADLAREALRRKWGVPSAGISSSTSARRPVRSGSNRRATVRQTRSPAPAVESPSATDQPASQAPSSTAPSTDGSTQETGQDPVPQQVSSEASAPATPVTPDTTEPPASIPSPKSPPEPAPAKTQKKATLTTTPSDEAKPVATDASTALHLAREAFDIGDYDAAEELLNEAAADKSLAPMIGAARSDIARKRAQAKAK
jgi:hypothetical protein